MNLTKKEELNFQQSTVYHICKQTNRPFSTNMETKKTKRNFKVWDHCHITGEFRGAAHNACNINYRLKLYIPVIFHNLKGYDAHFILQAANKVSGVKNISAIL
jgi:hypothetical protein